MINTLIELHKTMSQEQFKLLLNTVRDDVEFGKKIGGVYTDKNLKLVFESAAKVVRRC
ncbi:MAG: hypothetical protein E7D27_11430 [Clostridium celatum]|nr:hypothetical protein [Clostridium celatum]